MNTKKPAPGYILKTMNIIYYLTQHEYLVKNNTSGWPTILAYRLFLIVKLSNWSEGDGGAHGSSAAVHGSLSHCVQTQVTQAAALSGW